MFRISTQGSLLVNLNLKKTAIKQVAVRSLSFSFYNSCHPYTTPKWHNQSYIRPWNVDSDNKTWFNTRVGYEAFPNSFPYDGATRFGMMPERCLPTAPHTPYVPVPFGMPQPYVTSPFVTSPYVPSLDVPVSSMPFINSMMPFNSMPFTVPFSSPIPSDVSWFHKMKLAPFAASPFTDRALFGSWPVSTMPFNLPFTVPFSGLQMKPTSHFAASPLRDRTFVESSAWPVSNGYSDAAVSTIPNWNRFEDASTRVVTRRDVTMLFLYAKNEQRLTFTDIAHKIGRSDVWTTSAILGQQEMSHREAELICGVLGFDKDAKLKSKICVLLTEPPMRGWNDAVPVDPTLYRFFEMLQVYGGTFKALINEKFGDGVMSAVDLKVDLEKRQQPDGTPRIKITFDGAFEPYRPW